MDNLLLVATSNGLIVCEQKNGEWQEVRRGLNGQAVTSVIAREGVILAGTEDGVYRSDDDGESWVEASAGLSLRHVRWMAYHPDQSDFEFAGTEPAGIFVSHNGAQTWRACPEVAHLRDQHGWYLPYSPEAGCVRGFAFYGSHVYAAVEVGGLLRSEDNGETWRLIEGSTGNPEMGGETAPDIFPDVHSIAVHPASPDVLFAPTGGGFYRSDDGGKTWACLLDDYCRAVWLDPADPNHLILGPAQRVGGLGRIDESRDGGYTWQTAAQGFRVPWRERMVERFAQVNDQLFAVLSDGELFATPLAALNWQHVLPQVTGIAAVTSMVA